MNTKNIIVILIALFLLGGIWFLTAPKAGYQTSAPKESATSSTSTPETTATSTEQQKKQESPQQSKPAEPPRITLTKSDFHYDIEVGKTPCGDRIGSFDVVSSDPSKELYWGFTGAKPIWLSFSNVEGKTPTTVDMTFNCIMSGAENDINWTFTIVEKTKEGKWIDGYYRAVKLTGTIK